MIRTIFRSCAVSLTVLLATAAVVPSQAVAAPAALVQSTSSRIEVTATANDLLAPASVAAGLVTISVTTTAVNSGWIGLLRLRAGATWETFRDAYRKIGSTDRAQILQGSAELAAAADLLGGVQTHSAGPGTFAQNLAPGDYILFDHQDFRNNPANLRHRTLHVYGSPCAGDPAATATLTSKVVPGVGPRFVLSGTVRVGQPIRFVNTIGQANEAILWKLAPGATESDVQAWIAKFGDTGQFPMDPPPFGAMEPGGLLPISPGKSVVVVPPLEPGKHVVLTWMKDATDGTMLIKKGMYKILDVR